MSDERPSWVIGAERLGELLHRAASGEDPAALYSEEYRRVTRWWEDERGRDTCPCHASASPLDRCAPCNAGACGTADALGRRKATCACCAQHVSTRRKAPSGTVHEMADRGVGTACGRDLPEPWAWTDDSVTCQRCKAVADA